MRSPSGFEKMRSVNLYVLFLIVLAVIWVLGQAVWWHKYAYPYSPQLEMDAARYGKSLASGAIADVFDQLKQSTYQPPLYEFSIGVVNAIRGFSLGNTIILNTLLAMLAAWSIFRQVKVNFGAFAGSIAGLLFLGHGMVFASSRVAQREFGLLCLTSFSLYFLSDRQLLQKSRTALSFGIIFAAGMLTKWTFIIYNFFPAAITGLARLVEAVVKKQSPRRAIMLAGLSLVLIFLICAPWYLGVLDLDYLWSSKENDPSPGGIAWLLRFYPIALGDGTIFGETSTYVLIALAVLAVAKFRRAALVPAISFFSTLALLLLIKHKETRYFISAMPALAILAGMTFSLVPRRKWLRMSLYFLVAAVAVWNYIELSFMAPNIPQASGTLRPLRNASCLNEGASATRRILHFAADRGSAHHRREGLALHPLNQNIMEFNFDLLSLSLMTERLEDRVTILGYDLIFYPRFISEFDRIDVLVVSDIVWTEPDSEIQKLMEGWRHFQSIDREEKGEAPTEPRQREAVQQAFRLEYDISSPCFPTLHVYVRNEDGTGDGAQP